MKESEIERCPECGNSNLVYDHDTGEIVCSQCGLVIEERELDKGPERRAYTLEEWEKRTRIGGSAVFSVHDKGLSTTFRLNDPDAFGKKPSVSTRAKMWRLKKYQIHSRVHTAVERNLVQAIAELDRLLDQLEIKSRSVKEEAALIYRLALKENLVRGRSIAAMMAASLYVACRRFGVSRNLKEVSKASLARRGRHTSKDVARYYRLLLWKLSLKMPIANPLNWISKIAEKADISGETQGLAVKILHQAREKGIHFGKDPRSLAAALLYIAYKKNWDEKDWGWRTQREIAEAAGVSEVTLRNRLRELERKLGSFLKLKDSWDFRKS